MRRSSGVIVFRIHIQTRQNRGVLNCSVEKAADCSKPVERRFTLFYAADDSSLAGASEEVKGLRIRRSSAAPPRFAGNLKPLAGPPAKAPTILAAEFRYSIECSRRAVRRVCRRYARPRACTRC